MISFSQQRGGAIKAIQRGVSGVGVVNISTVNVATTELRGLGGSDLGGYVRLLSSTQIEVVRGAASSGVQVSWELTEFYPT